MQGRFKLWIAAVIGLFVLGFLIGFAPIRPAPRGFQVQNVFRFNLAQPVVQDPSTQLDSASGELQAQLKDKVADLNYAKFLPPTGTEIEVATFATTEQVAATDRATVTKELTAKYKGLTEATVAQTTEKPLYTLGSTLAVYRPRPQIRLGLDLQGGAQVVLLARPETTIPFLGPEDLPLVKAIPAAPGTPAAETTPPPATPVAPAAPAAAASTPSTAQTLDELGKHILDALKQQGVDVASTGVETQPPARTLVVGRDVDRQVVASVESPAPNRITVRTRAKNELEADRDENTVQRYLENAYPGVALQLEKDKVHHVFVGKAPMGKAGEDYVTADQVQNVVDRRLVQMSDIREPVIQTQGDDRVIVELPGVKDPNKVVDILGQTAELQFCLIPDKYDAPATASEDNNYDTWTNKNTHQEVPWSQVYAESDVKFTGADLKPTSKVQPGQGLELVVGFELRDDKKEPFRKFTAGAVGRLMAITLDGVCQMAPVIRNEIPGSGIIEGKFTAEDATKLALLLNAGALPVPLDIAENRTVSATLGADSIRQSLLAGAVGFVLVIAFMILAYRVPGGLADIALILYLVLLMAMLKLANATLTLPGVAGFIMSLGMAVDANILIFERLKEELYSGKTSRAAIVAGFERAWTAILDANVTTLIGASVLYFLGTSSVKSFAVTLFLGVVVHLFTAVTVSRWLVTMFAHTKYGSKLSSYGVPKPE